MEKVIVRPATREDLQSLGKQDMPTMKAFVGEVGGRIIGLGGFYFTKGRWVGFCDLSDEALKYKKALVKIGKEAMRGMEISGHKYIYAEIDESHPGARRWVESLGFRHDTKTGLHRWQRSAQ